MSATLLASLGRGDRIRAVRFADTDARRAHLDRIVERLALRTTAPAIRRARRQIDALFEAGQPVPQELRDEHEALDVKLTKL